jgi:hypothetical protein
MARSASPGARLTCAILALGLSACATAPADPPTDQEAQQPRKVGDLPSDSPTSRKEESQLAPWRTHWPAQDMAHWKLQTFPGKKPVEYKPAMHQGRSAVHAKADRAMSVLMQPLQPTVLPASGVLEFSWWVPALNPLANLSDQNTDDSPVRLVLAFDGDKGRFTAKESLQDELLRVLTGQPKPYATLMYVWCTQCEPGTIITNARSSRIRKIAIQSGSQGLGQWQTHQRNVLADFEKAFGEPAGPLIGVGLMTDSDNTQSASEAWYGDIFYRAP